MFFDDKIENKTYCNSNIRFENIPLCLHPIPHPTLSTAAPPLCCQHMFQLGEYIISNIGAFSFQQTQQTSLYDFVSDFEKVLTALVQ